MYILKIQQVNFKHKSGWFTIDVERVFLSLLNGTWPYICHYVIIKRGIWYLIEVFFVYLNGSFDATGYIIKKNYT